MHQPALILGLQETAGGAEGAGLRQTFRLLDLPEMWILVLVLLPLLAFASWIGYGREKLPGPARAALIGLRFLALAGLLVVLFRPVLVQQREEVRKADVLVLVDDSASMRRRDAYSGDQAEVRAAVRELAPDGRDPMRLELARAVLEQSLLPHLTERGYEARAFSFGEGLAPLAGPDALAGRGRATHLGDALVGALASHRGRHVTDVVLISDGRSNGGATALDAARTAALSGVPVHTLVIGDTRPERNALVQIAEAPAGALAGDQIAVTVRVVGRGTQGLGEAAITLEELPPEGGRGQPRVVAEEAAALSESGERVILIAPPAADSQVAERRFRVSLAPLPEETLLDDNAVEFTVHVTPEKIRVLYVDGYPRWEYRYLKNLLLRADQNLQVQCCLLSATADFPQESTRGLPPLTRVPTGRRELLENYDVIILGDINPRSEAISPDPLRVAEFQDSLVEFVERGGGILFQAGVDDNPRAFVLSTQLEELMPVAMDRSGVLRFEGDTTREMRPLLEDPTAPHEVVRLHDDPRVNRQLWESPDGLRGFYWYCPVPRAKPGAQVLLRHPTDQAAGGERHPLLVVGHYPAGRTMFVAFDSTWRWRFHYGDRYHERFWRNAIRWLSLGRLKSGDRRYRVETTRNRFALGERATIEARVLDEDFRPSEAAAQTVWWRDPDDQRGQLELAAAPGRPGLYRGSLEPERPGLHRVWIEISGKRVSSSEFEVVLPSRENADPSPDPDTLSELSVATGGAAVDLARLDDLLAELPGGEERREPISSRLDDVWDRWATLLLVLAVLSVEWILRKRLELV